MFLCVEWVSYGMWIGSGVDSCPQPLCAQSNVESRVLTDLQFLCNVLFLPNVPKHKALLEKTRPVLVS